MDYQCVTIGHNTKTSGFIQLEPRKGRVPKHNKMFIDLFFSEIKGFL